MQTTNDAEQREDPRTTNNAASAPVQRVVGRLDFYAEFDLMTWPLPGLALAELERRLRWEQHNVIPSDLLVAASIVRAYEQLVIGHGGVRDYVCRKLCEAKAAAEEAG